MFKKIHNDETKHICAHTELYFVIGLADLHFVCETFEMLGWQYYR